MSPRRREGVGDDFLLKIPRGGGGLPGGVGRGREGVCVEFGGGGLNILFRGRNPHQVVLFASKEFNEFLRGHLTCTNKRAQAAEQKIARNESFLALPVLCMCSALVPSGFFHL